MTHRRTSSTSSGITDEVAVGGHDLIHNAELEEQKLHGKDSMIPPDEGEEPSQSASLGGMPSNENKKQQKKGAMEQMKDTFNMK